MLVVDASIVLAWSIPNEKDDVAMKALDVVERSGAVAPMLLRYEVANVLMLLHRREQISATDLQSISGAVDALSIRFVAPDEPQWFENVTATAREFSLSVYDASYLTLARSMTAKLATLDKKLVAAAKATKCLWS